MIIIKDKKRVLNLNPTVMYLMLSKSEASANEERLKRIISTEAVTKGLFKIEMIKKGKTYIDELPADMTRAAKLCNIMVRLVDSIHGTFCYAMDVIDLKADEDVIEKELTAFVENVCEENIIQFDILEKRDTNSAMNAIQKYEESNIVRKVFEAALAGERIDATPAREIIEKDTTDEEMSQQVAAGAFNGKYDEAARIDYYSRTRPERRPDIKLDITKIATGKPRKDGSPKIKWGFKISVDDKVFSVRFGNNYQNILYAATIFANIEGTALLRKDFESNTSKDEWLHGIHRAFQLSSDFNNWREKIPTEREKAVYGTRSQLWKHICNNEIDPWAFYYLGVITDRKTRGKTRYKIRLSADNIIIDQEFERNRSNSL